MTRPAFRRYRKQPYLRRVRTTGVGFNVPACQISCADLLRGNARARTEHVVGVGNPDDQSCRQLVDGKWPWRRRDRAMRRCTLRGRIVGIDREPTEPMPTGCRWAVAVRADDHHEPEARWSRTAHGWGKSPIRATATPIRAKLWVDEDGNSASSRLHWNPAARLHTNMAQIYRTSDR